MSLLTPDSGASLLTGQKLNKKGQTASEEWVDAQQTRYDKGLLVGRATGTAEATHEGRGPLGLLTGALAFLGRGGSAVEGLVSGVAGLDRVGQEAEDEQDNGLERAWKALVHGEKYTAGSFDWWGHYDKSDPRWEKVLKGAADFGIDVATDPLTYLTGGTGGIGRKAAAEMLASSAARTIGSQLDAAALRALALSSEKGAVATESGTIARRLAESQGLKADAVAKAEVDAVNTHLGLIGSRTLRATGVRNSDDLTGDAAVAFLGKAELGHQMATLYLKGGPTAVRRKLLTDFGKEQGEQLWKQLPEQVKGGIRFRANPLGSGGTSLTGGGGATVEKLLGTKGADAFDAGISEAKNWLRRKSAPVLDHIGGDAERYNQVLKSIADPADPKALTFAQFAQARLLGTVKNQSFRDLNDAEITLVGANVAARNVAVDEAGEEPAAAAYRSFYEDRKLAQDTAKNGTGWRQGLAKGAVKVHDWLDDLHRQAVDADVDMNHVDDYLARIMTEEYRSLKQLKAPGVAGGGAVGKSGPLKTRSGAFTKSVMREDGTSDFVPMTPTEIEQAMKKTYGDSAVKVFEDDPLKVVAAYGKAMHRVISFKRMTNAGEELGLFTKAGTKFVEGTLDKPALNAAARAADADAAKDLDFLGKRDKYAGKDLRAAELGLANHQRRLDAALLERAAAGTALAEHRLAAPSEGDERFLAAKPGKAGETPAEPAAAPVPAAAEPASAADIEAMEAEVRQLDDMVQSAEADGADDAENLWQALQQSKAALEAAKAGTPLAVREAPATSGASTDSLFDADVPETFAQARARYETRLEELKEASAAAARRVSELEEAGTPLAASVAEAQAKKATVEQDMEQLRTLFDDDDKFAKLVTAVDKADPAEQQAHVDALMNTMFELYRNGAVRAARDGKTKVASLLNDKAGKALARDAFRNGGREADDLAQTLLNGKYVRAGSSDTGGANAKWALDGESADLLVTNAVRDIARSHMEAARVRDTKLDAFVDNIYTPLFALMKTTQTVGRGPGFIARNVMGGTQLAWQFGTTAADFIASGRATGAEFLARKRLSKAGLVGSELERAVEDALAQKLGPELAGLWMDASDAGHFSSGLTLEQASQHTGGDISQAVEHIGSGDRWLTAKRDLMPNFKDGSLSQRATRQAVNFFPNFAPVRLNAKGSELSEKYMRFAQYVAARRKYGDHETANLMVNASQFQYDPSLGLSELERRVFRNLAPYYVWMRSNISAQFRLLAADPGRIALIARAQTELAPAVLGEGGYGEADDGVMPAWVERKMGFRTAFKPDGEHSMVLNLESPINDLNAMFNWSLRNPVNLRQVAASTNPLLKLPIEQATGVNLDTGASFQERGARASQWQVMLGLTEPDENGVERISDRTARALSLLAPPVSQAQTMIPGLGSDEQDQRQVSSWASYLGAPTSTLTDRQVAGEQLHRAVVLENASAKAATKAGIDPQLLSRYAGRTADSEALALLMPQLASMTRQRAEAQRAAALAARAAR